MVADADKLITTANDTWDGLLRQDPPDIAQISRWQLAHHLAASGPVCKTLRPHFVTAQQHAADREAAEAVFAALCLAGDFVASQPRLRERYLGLFWDEFADWFALQVGHSVRHVNANLDAYVTEAGLQFLELNAFPAGREFTDRISEMFSGLAIFARFQQHHPLRALSACADRNAAFLAAYREWGGREQPVLGGVRTPRGETSVLMENTYAAVVAEFARVGIAMHWAEPHEIAFDGKQLRAGPHVLNLMVQPNLHLIRKMGPAVWGPLLSAVRAGAVCLTHPYSICHHKSLFAAVTDPASGLTLPASLRRAVHDHVPWTRLLCAERTSDPDGQSVDLLGWVSAHRERLVIKPADAFGGEGVVLGWDIEASHWDRMLAQVVAGPGRYIVQQRVTTRKTRWPFLAAGIPDLLATADRCPYLVSGRMGGYRSRVSPTEWTNVSRDAGYAPTFVLTE